MKILRVNMARLQVKIETAEESYRFLGGRAFIARFMLDEVNPECEPLGRHNKLLFVPGLLGGSNIPSSGRISIGGKSPLTGGIKESNGGGITGLKLGRLGYKAVVIEDMPQDGKRYILHITPDDAGLLPADAYWGLGVYEAVKKMQQEFG